MKKTVRTLATGLGLAAAPTLALAQDLTNAGATIVVQPGATFYVGIGGVANQAGTLTNAGALRIDGPLTNAGTLDLGTGTMEVRGDFTNVGSVGPGTSITTFSGVADQLLTPGGATLYQVIVNKPTAGANTLRLAGDLTVNNALSLSSGLVNTSAASGTLYILSLPNGASLSGEASGRYVLGRLQITRNGVSGAPVDFGHGAVLDPTTNNLGTVSITRTAGLQTADVSYGQNLGNVSKKGIDRIWAVSAATQPSATVQLTLSWLPDNDNGLTDFSQAWGWQQPAAGQAWAAVGAPTNSSSRSLTLAPTVLNRFTVSNATNPLPVTLVSFTAQAQGPDALLRWATASELRNDHFEVEASPDGQTFRRIGVVAGAGTSSQARNYQLVDPALAHYAASPVYYRLRQVDTDGTTTYSPVRAVVLPAGLALFPNPATQTATLTGAVPGAPVTVLDAVGRLVLRMPADGIGTATLVLPAGLAAGVYVVRTGQQTLRLTVAN